MGLLNAVETYEPEYAQEIHAKLLKGSKTKRFIGKGRNDCSTQKNKCSNIKQNILLM